MLCSCIGVAKGSGEEMGSMTDRKAAEKGKEQGSREGALTFSPANNTLPLPRGWLIFTNTPIVRADVIPLRNYVPPYHQKIHSILRWI